ncbi:MAG: hypothetical protein JRJ46_05695 [Deltaproteobacteria bacterium]|nr:hypothetical protein [Deltaproteobacteria bacterium]
MKSVVALLISILLIFAVPLYAKTPEGDITVEAEGYGTSTKEALLQAKRSAVEEGIGVVLISQTEVKNFEVKKDVILSTAMGSVKKYSILQEEKQSDGNFHVKIQAVVSLASIKSDLTALKILLESMDKPRIMVVIREAGGNAAETAIIDYLTGKEFQLVDPSAVAALMHSEHELIKRATEGDPAAAAQIGALNGAEYSLVGNVSKGLMKSALLGDTLLGDTGMKSGQANITVKVVNCSTAAIIASKSATSAAVHVSEEIAMAQAAEKAAKKLMDRELFEKIVSSFQDMINNGISLDVTIENVKKFKMQKAIRQAIAEISDVVAVRKRSFGGGKLQLSVQFKGNADSFSETIDGATVQGKNLSVTDIAGSRVVIQLE